MRKNFNCRWFKDFDENVPYQWCGGWLEYEDRFAVVKEKWKGSSHTYFYNVLYLSTKATVAGDAHRQIGFVSEALDNPKHRFRCALLLKPDAESTPVESLEDGINIVKARFLLEHGDMA